MQMVMRIIRVFVVVFRCPSFSLSLSVCVSLSPFFSFAVIFLNSVGKSREEGLGERLLLLREQV